MLSKDERAAFDELIKIILELVARIEKLESNADADHS